MRHKVLPQALAQAPTSPTADPGLATLKEPSRDLLTRRRGGGNRLVPTSSGSAAKPSAGNQPAGDVFKAKLAESLGCTTSETAVALLEQIVALEHPTTTMEPACVNALWTNAIAVLAELRPATATEALLAAQMVGAHRAAMMFLANATKREDSPDGRDRNVLRALRLMRLFAEQIEAMAKLKGKSGQQRVVVEHVNVAAGGQAIVGTVIPGGRGAGVEDRG